MTDKEIQQFENELIQSVRDMKNRHFAAKHKVDLNDIAKARINSGFSQKDFANLMGISPRTLQEWEQGRRQPSGPAQTLLKIAIHRPDVLHEIVAI
jgi:putative transcriptional regulator